MPKKEKKLAYTDKQRKRAEKLEEGLKQRGLTKEEAGRRTRATVGKLNRGTATKSKATRSKKDVEGTPSREGRHKGTRGLSAPVAFGSAEVRLKRLRRPEDVAGFSA